MGILLSLYFNGLELIAFLFPVSTNDRNGIRFNSTFCDSGLALAGTVQAHARRAPVNFPLTGRQIYFRRSGVFRLTKQAKARRTPGGC